MSKYQNAVCKILGHFVLGWIRANLLPLCGRTRQIKTGNLISNRIESALFHWKKATLASRITSCGKCNIPEYEPLKNDLHFLGGGESKLSTFPFVCWICFEAIYIFIHMHFHFFTLKWHKKRIQGWHFWFKVQIHYTNFILGQMVFKHLFMIKDLPCWFNSLTPGRFELHFR